MVFLAKAGAAARNDMPSIVAQKIPEVAEKTVTMDSVFSSKNLTAKDANAAKKFRLGFVAFATFAVSRTG